MASSVNYSTPIYVDGYQCWNCTDVANAKRHIDPAHPKDGPFGIDAAANSAGGGGAAAKLGGGSSASGASAAATPGQTYQPGSLVNVAA